MVNTGQNNFQSELSVRLQSLMFLRVVFVSLLLGLSVVIQIKETKTYFGHIQTFHYLFIAVVYFLTFVYAVVFRYIKNFSWFAYLQILVDTFFITAIVYTTGGIESVFSSLYNLCIICGSLMLYRKGGLLIASSSGILYALLLCLHYYDIISPLGSHGTYIANYKGLYLLYLISVNIAGFYVVAYLSSYLSEQARKSRNELKSKQIDIDKLEVLNESIINSITSGLIAVDGLNKITLLNPAAEEIFGIKADHVYSQKIEEVLPFFKYVLTDIQPASTQKTVNLSPFVDLPFVKPGDRKQYLRLFMSPLRFPRGDQKGHILIFQDITQAKQLEEEMKKLEGLALIGEFSAGIAHEIRNPMASISGSIQMLRDGLEKDAISSRLMDIVSREVNRLNSMINDFLFFARPEKANIQEFDLNHLILESLELLKNSQYWTKMIGTHTSLSLSIKLESDLEQIKQVLWNLFLNACEAMPGGGSIYIVTNLETATPKSDQKEMVKILVHDTGKGFDEGTLSQIFTPFFTTKKQGSGLGLAIVKGILDRLHGEIRAKNHPEGGAEITILLPISPEH